MFAFLKDAIVGHICQRHILEGQHAKQLLMLYKKSTKYFSSESVIVVKKLPLKHPAFQFYDKWVRY